MPSINSGHVAGVQNGNSTSYVINTPGHAEGDVIYIAIAQDGAAANMSLTDFTELYADIQIDGGGVADATFSLFYKTAGAAEPASYTVTTTVSERAAWIAWSVDNDGGINVQAASAEANSATATIVTITPTVDGCLAIAIIATDGVATPLSASTENQKLDESSVTSGATVGIYFLEIAAAGLAGGDTVTLNSAQKWLGARFAIAPAEYTPPTAPTVVPVATAQRIRTYLPA